jgi:D-3-phosphoglycerate dehydrogenase
MPEWKILITDGLEESGQSLLRRLSQVDDRRGVAPEELAQIIGEYDALIVRSRTKVTPSLFAAAARLKVVGRAGVGVDNIDLEAARQRQVTVVNAPAATTLAVAEHTLALILALARRIPQADAAMKAGSWLKNEIFGLELSGKTIGIIGVGSIGSLVAERAAAFGMAALGYDPLLSDEQVRQRGAAPVSLDELYARSDFISLHVPLLPATRGMISAETLSIMKPGVRLVCTARGGLIDEDALLAALESGQVAGAALDVFASEPPGLTSLVAHPNLIATPHISGQTSEAQMRAAVDIASEVIAALRGEPLRWKVA